jgi:hypothetical protein
MPRLKRHRHQQTSLTFESFCAHALVDGSATIYSPCRNTLHNLERPVWVPGRRRDHRLGRSELGPSTLDVGYILRLTDAAFIIVGLLYACWSRSLLKPAGVSSGSFPNAMRIGKCRFRPTDRHFRPRRQFRKTVDSSLLQQRTERLVHAAVRIGMDRCKIPAADRHLISTFFCGLPRRYKGIFALLSSGTCRQRVQRCTGWKHRVEHIASPTC